MQGSELKELRKAMGMTQSALADALGLTSVFVGMMERDERPIERRTALAVQHLAMAAKLDQPREALLQAIADNLAIMKAIDDGSLQVNDPVRTKTRLRAENSLMRDAAEKGA